MQNALFFDEDEAVRFLRERGYRVIKEEYPEGSCVTTIPQLVQFFYARRRFYNPDRKFPESIDMVSDRTYIGGFVKSREKLGLNRKTAVKECAQIIDALFKYEDLLGLKEPVISPRVLNVRWLMDKVCLCLNGDVPEAGELDSELIVREHNKYYDRHFATEDLQLADEIRTQILERMRNEQK